MRGRGSKRYRQFCENRFRHLGGFWPDVHRFANDDAITDRLDRVTWGCANLGTSVSESINSRRGASPPASPWMKRFCASLRIPPTGKKRGFQAT